MTTYKLIIPGCTTGCAGAKAQIFTSDSLEGLSEKSKIPLYQFTDSGFEDLFDFETMTVIKKEIPKFFHKATSSNSDNILITYTKK